MTDPLLSVHSSLLPAVCLAFILSLPPSLYPSIHPSIHPSSISLPCCLPSVLARILPSSHPLPLPLHAPSQSLPLLSISYLSRGGQVLRGRRGQCGIPEEAACLAWVVVGRGQPAWKLREVLCRTVFSVWWRS
jgi:hypothetical protein